MLIRTDRIRENQQKNLPKLLARQMQEGRSIVEYQYIISFIVVSMTSSKLVWIREGRSHYVRGIIASIPSLILGWWSLQGLFYTLGIIIKNIMGGIDYTLLLTSPTGNAHLQNEIIRKIERQNKIQSLAFVGVLFVIFAIAFWFCVLPYI